MSSKLRIIVGGLVGQFPFGGVAWDYFHYLLGLHELGHDVYYHEDTWVWPYDPIRRTPVDDADYTVKFLSDFFNEHAPALAGKWHYVLLHNQHYGMSESAFNEVAESADIFLNVSGACLLPARLSSKCVKVFLDTDPGYNQIMLREKPAWSPNIEKWFQLVASHDRHLTYAENINGPDCLIPRLDFDWRPTRCVVTLPPWKQIKESPPAAHAPFTTVMTWDYFGGKLIHNGIQYGTKVEEYEKFRDLPIRTETPLLLAVGGEKGPWEMLASDGWRAISAHGATLTPASYQQFIKDSAGEWSVAKNVYVATRSGWFSCRTACYLAAGRPCVVEETGWSKFIPSGNGLFAFSTMAETIDALNSIAADPVRHRAAAYEIAREYFAPDKVLPAMIDAILRD